MGLDIYLYRYENREDTERLVSEYDKHCELNWSSSGKYEDLSDEQKDSIRQKNKAFALSLGLNEGGHDSRQEKIEIDSSNYPDHYFKVGYFRSSYNGSGINRILSNLGLPDLYEIFNRCDNDDYCFQPDWELVKKNANEVLNKLKIKPNLRCFDVSINELSGDHTDIYSQEHAINKTIEELAKDSFGDGWSSSAGHFYPKGLEIVSIIPGKRKRLLNDLFMPTTYIVMKGEQEWYCHAIEIVIETCDFVLSKQDKDKYFLHWSS